ncbi:MULTISPECIES: LysR family transcriptional regulator [Ramlibacter]|uniref:LysR family transcriptional regulator n=1 Tax=Ramlibacter pinisoli TaxID=2682844 RepID=A0A6N8IXR0_9BURK|nr:MULTISPECIES: LysR family transcriptional regulator [Ramlibacter]MBA2961832.1 LysR family transcriptional regulator [Ramlibacter sp. CGMCC 1.13660]MVQ31774.1 LysR family transcriptional regulator [Ramlibacter pinisoli]
MKSPIASTQYSLTAADLAMVLSLVRGGTLAAAAQRCGSDASTVFRSLQRLEQRLGQRLFERTRQGYLPTDTASDVARHAERIETELEAARAAAFATGAQVSGRVRLSTTDSVLRGLVLPCLPALARAHPLLQLELRATNELLSLSKRDADIALRATAKPPEHLVGRSLGRIQFAVCGLRSRATARTPALEQLDWIAPDDAMPDHPSVRWRRQHLQKVAPRHLVDGIVSVADAITAGLGVGIVPLFMLAVEPQLKALTPPLEGCESSLWLLAHPESRHLRRIAAVYQHLGDGIRLPQAEEPAGRRRTGAAR